MSVKPDWCETESIPEVGLLMFLLPPKTAWLDKTNSGKLSCILNFAVPIYELFESHYVIVCYYLRSNPFSKSFWFHLTRTSWFELDKQDIERRSSRTLVKLLFVEGGSKRWNRTGEQADNWADNATRHATGLPCYCSSSADVLANFHRQDGIS